MLNVKNLLIGLALIIGLTAGSLWTGVWNPGWNPFQKPSGGLVESAIGKLLSLDSLKIEGSFEAEMRAQIKKETTEEEIAEEKTSFPPYQALLENIRFVFNFTTLIDETNSKAPKTQTNLTLSVGSEGMEFLVAGETRTFGQDIYLQLTNLPPIPFLTEKLEGIKNQWFKIEGEKLEELSQGKVKLMDEKQQKEVLQELKGLLRDKRIFRVEKNLGSEQVHQQAAKHYLVGFDKETLKQLIPEYLKSMQKYIPAEESEEYKQKVEEIVEDFPQKFDEAWGKIKEINFEAWIAKGYLKKVRWAKEIDLSSIEQLKTQLQEGKANIAIELNFSEFNKKFNIELPKEFKPIDQLFSSESWGLPSE